MNARPDLQSEYGSMFHIPKCLKAWSKLTIHYHHMILLLEEAKLLLLSTIHKACRHHQHQIYTILKADVYVLVEETNHWAKQILLKSFLFIKCFNDSFGMMPISVTDKHNSNDLSLTLSHSIAISKVMYVCMYGHVCMYACMAPKFGSKYSIIYN